MPEGNFLGKGRKNFFLSNDCVRYIVELAYRFGLSEGAVIEISIREKYERTFEKRESMEPARSQADNIRQGLPKASK